MKNALCLAIILMLGAISLFVVSACFSEAGDDDDNDNDNDDVSDDDNNSDDDDDQLEWQDPPNTEFIDWGDAVTYCKNLDLNGHSDWRLPSVEELRSFIVGCSATQPGGSCPFTDSCTDIDTCVNSSCDGCAIDQGPGSPNCYWGEGYSGVPGAPPSGCGWFWTSASISGGSGNGAIGIDFCNAQVGGHDKDEGDGGQSSNVRCVRGGNN